MRTGRARDDGEVETHLRSEPVVTAAYVDLRTRVVELLRSLPESAGDLLVPHCPGWTVRDLASHLAGVPEDILAGRMEGVTTEAWTQSQVERHRGQSLATIAADWAATAPGIDPLLPHVPPPTNSQLVFDAVTHEHDLRHAIGRPGARDSAAVEVAVGFLLDMGERRRSDLARRLDRHRIDRFDLLRVLSGRRSAEQIERFDLDATEIVTLLKDSPLTPPALSIDEG